MVGILEVEPEARRMRIRVWIRRKLVYDKQNPEGPGTVDYVRFMEDHVAELASSPHMIELEFMDDPDPVNRFVRFGTDPDMMAFPIPLTFVE